MDRRTKLLGVGAFWMPVYLPIFIAIVAVASIRGAGEPDDDLLVPFLALFALHVLAIVVSLTTMVFLAVDAFQNPRVDKDGRIMWLVLLLLVGIVAAPVYWWKHVRPGPLPRRERGGPWAPERP